MTRHPVHEESPTPIQVSPNGWMATKVGLYKFYTEQSPPRQYSHWEQFKIDWTSAEIYKFFVPLAAILSVCIAGLWWMEPIPSITTVLLTVGAILALPMQYLVMLSLFVSGLKHATLYTGILQSYEDHPLTKSRSFRKLRSGTIVLPDCDTLPVAFDIPEMQTHLDAGTSLEVLVEFSQGNDYASTIAYRPLD